MCSIRQGSVGTCWMMGFLCRGDRGWVSKSEGSVSSRPNNQECSVVGSISAPAIMDPNVWMCLDVFWDSSESFIEPFR